MYQPAGRTPSKRLSESTFLLPYSYPSATSAGSISNQVQPTLPALPQPSLSLGIAVHPILLLVTITRKVKTFLPHHQAGSQKTHPVPLSSPLHNPSTLSKLLPSPPLILSSTIAILSYSLLKPTYILFNSSYGCTKHLDLSSKDSTYNFLLKPEPRCDLRCQYIDARDSKYYI